MLTHGVWFFRYYPARWYYFPIHMGWSGVDLFFVLSGFLITGILIRTRGAVNRGKSFYMRRFLRIFPLYYGALLALFIAVHYSAWLRPEFPAHNWRGWLVYLTYLQNWAFLYNPIYWTRNIVGHFWSLAIEEQFYLVWPWIVWALSARSIVRLCIAGMIASLALRIILMWHFGPDNWAYQFSLTPTRGEGLLMGSALAAYSAEFGSVPKRILVAMAAAGGAIILAMLVANPQAFFSHAADAYRFTVGITGFDLIYGALVASSQYFVPGLTPALNFGWLRSFGKYSYGIYVYHAPLYHLSGHILTRAGYSPTLRTRYAIPFLLVNIAVAYGIAWLSFNFYEAYFLRMKDRFRPVHNLNRDQESACSVIKT